MTLYAVLRRNGWPTQRAFNAAVERSIRAIDPDSPDSARWILSYVLQDRRGSIGSICFLEAASPEEIRRHSFEAQLPIDEIVAIRDTIVIGDEARYVAIPKYQELMGDIR